MSRWVLITSVLFLGVPAPGEEKTATDGSVPGGSVHWAFRPPVPPPLPEVREPARVKNDVDRFIESGLEKVGLTLASEAARAALLRRVTFDLTGLPPSPGEIAAFLSDPAPDGYKRVVERLLASPHHGERWGRHWLDAAGYADSNGYFSADSDRPLAYRYRDYVVRSLNADKPFDRFVEEQIAGDELAAYEPDGDVTPEKAELLTATHFLRNAQDGTGESDGNELEVLIDKLSVLDGTLQIVSTSLLGLTLQCARCHDHKFDPIRQTEYYRLRAVFAGGYSPERWHKPNERVVTAGTRAEREDYRKKKETVERELKALEKSLEGFTAPLREELVEEKLLALEEPVRKILKKARETAKDKLSSEEKEMLKKHQSLLSASDEELQKRFKDFARVRDALKSSIEEKRRELPPPPPQIAALVEDRPDPPPHRLLKRGLASEPGEVVEPGVPAVLCTAGNRYQVEVSPGRKSTGRRLALARWLTSRENPLLARVTVNRIWQHHFGRGLVATPDNFGLSGAPPSHPQLLDYLASEFVRGGWSLKRLHRLLVTSAAYRQSSKLRPEAQALDPENRLLWRYPLTRLDAESVRDAMLAVTGELDRKMGGPYIPTRRGSDGQVVVDEKAEGAFRRSLYLEQKRTQPSSLLEVFDAPLIVGSCTRRSVSNTALQSLALLNSDFALARARALAARVAREGGPTDAERISLAFLLAWGRGPDPAERALAERFLQSQPAAYGSSKEGGERAWVDLCQMLFAASAFVSVE